MRRYDPVHEHHLILVGERDDDKKLNCGACGEEEKEIKLGGGGEKIYYWCTLCKSHFHDKCARLRVQIECFFHPCPIFLCSSSSSSSCIGGPYLCCSCFVWHQSKAFFYYCEPCGFGMCVECCFNMCAEYEDQEEVRLDVYCGRRILHTCHHHPLQPLSLGGPPSNHNSSSSSSSSSSSCRVCNMPCSLGPTWGCEPCNFHLHKSCLDFLPRVAEWKPRFSTSTDTWVLMPTPRPCNDLCPKKISSGLGFKLSSSWESLCIYCCLLSRLRSSVNVSEVISHFFHPYHDLNLILSPPSTCNACFKSLPHHFSYHCSSCDFFLCLDCAKSTERLPYEKHEVQHFCHLHPLELFTTSTQEDTNNHTCSFCERFCSAPFYRCGRRCQFYIHKSCLDLLPTNGALLNQTLALLTVPHFECTTCKRQLAGLAFYCRDSKCKFCVKCVLWPERDDDDDGRLSGVSHWHRFILHEARIKDKRRTCFLCKESCIAWTWSYKCSECDLFFHKSCLDSPTPLTHPIHPYEYLTFTKRSSSSEKDMACKLCLKDLSRNFPLFDWVYQNRKCDFWLDTQCATCLPSLEYQEHPHLLYVVVNMHGDLKCQVCGKSCQGSATFHCARPGCDFNLHLQCGPLPLMVKHVCHVHPLILKEYYVEDNDSDQFACHICEEERDPRLRVYCCSDGCLMTCDVKCVLNEVVPLLRGERGEVELRTPFPQVSCRVIGNKSVFAEPWSKSRIRHYFSYEKLLSPLEGQLRIESSDKDDDKAREEVDVNSYPFTWTALSYFLKLLRIPSLDIHALPLIRQYDGSTTEGEDDALPKLLGPIYKEFFPMYNIIDHRYNLSSAEKRALIFITCCVLHQMRITKVVDVTKDTILVWLGLLRFVQDKGRFNVGFVAANIKHVWQAHYYIQSKKIVDDKTQRLDREIEQVSMYNAEMRTKMDEIRIKLWEGEAKLRELRVMDKEHDTYRVVGSRGPMKKARSDALAIKWRTCYDSLVTFP